ncbi:MAG: Hsp20/alpha crystallin family protein [Bacteroidota bacterium]
MSLIKKTNGGLVPFRGLMSDFFEADDLLLNRLWKKDFVPAVNISETDKNYEIELVAPGLKKNEFKVNVENGILTISAEHQEEKKEKEKNYTRQEYSYNSFSRSFSLPDNSKDDDIKANYADGLLKLTIAKKVTTPSKAKEIAIS